MSYDENNPQHRKQLNDYLTRPNRVFTSNPKNKSNTDQRRAPLNKNSNTKVPPKNEFDFASNVMMSSYKLGETSNDTEKEIRKYLIQKIDSGIQLNSDEVRFMMDTKGPEYPKEASPKQMAELKTKIDKYKDIHFPKKPFKKVQRSNVTTAKNLQRGPVTPTNVPEIPDPRFQKIEKEVQDITKTENFDLNKYIREKSAERLKQQQEEHDRQFGRGGLPELVRPV